MESDVEESENSTDRPYLSLFRQHLAQFSQHIIGHTDEPCSSSFIPPAGYWTSAEKDSFFHALSIYSTLRPDLIAAQLEHKTIVDVCAYIDLLSEASAQEKNRPEVHRKDMDIAMEVSEKWVELEEIHGARFSSVQEYWDAAERRKRRDAIIDSEEAHVLKGMTDGDTRQQAQADFDAWKENFIASYKRKEGMASLSHAALRVLAYEFHMEETKIALPLAACADPETILPANVSDDIPIDPILLALSTPITAQPALQETAQSSSQTPCLSFELDNNIMVELAALSPKSRNRLHKRIYMRRKRAEATGTEPIGGIEPQVKGRRPKQLLDKPQSDTDSDEEMADVQPAVTTSSAKQRKPWKGGKTQARKFRDYLTESGIDTRSLEELKLDFFNLSGIERMMKLYNMAYSEPIADNQKNVTSAISADMIRVLHNIIAEFVTELLHRSIICREQENRLKANIKVWRRHEGDKESISPTNVAQALEIMGMSHLTKQKMFRKFFDRENTDDEKEDTEDTDLSDGDSGAVDEDSDQIASEDEARNERESAFTSLLRREMQPPIVRLPHHLSDSRHATGSDDELMADNTEDEENDLIAELEEEVKINHADAWREKQHEHNLWALNIES